MIVTRLPDPSTSLAVRGRELLVVGPRTRAQYLTGDPGSCVELRLHPGWSVGGIAASDLVDRVVSLGDGELVPADALVEDATHLLRTERVGVVARKLNVSERQLRKLFGQAVGLSPKHYARLDRVRRLLDHARPGSLAAAALTAGYYDQAHMTTEFRRVMGVSPGAFVAGRLPAPSDCPFSGQWA